MPSDEYVGVDNYTLVESQDGELVALVDMDIEPLEAFSAGGKDLSLEPDAVPLVFKEREFVRGYFPESIDPEAVYELGEEYLPDNSKYHFSQDEESWEEKVKVLLSKKRDEVTQSTNKTSQFTRPGTAPHADRVPASDDDCSRSYDATTGWDFS